MTTEAGEMGSASWYLRQLGVVLGVLRKDRLPIIVVTLVLTVLGAISGKMTNSTASSAQLVLTPVPVRADAEDPLSRMLAEPMDAKTASLLCMSDQVIDRTRELLEAPEALGRPIKSLQALRNALNFEITIAEETPYETTYSPVLRLVAKGASPSEARILVNTWAQACTELAEQYMNRRQSPVEEAFLEHADKVRTALDEADQKLETFRRENNREYHKERLKALTLLINETLALRAQSMQNREEQRAKQAALVAELTAEEAKLTLSWTPSGRLTALVAGSLGSADTGGEAPGMLEVEQLNPVYEVVRKEAVLAESAVAGYEAELEQIDAQLTAFEEEIRTLQAEAARIDRMDRELLRETEVLETVYQSAASKYEYARMAAGLPKSEIHILSEGAEWRMPRFRRAILFGVAAGFWGFLLACLVSVLVRQVLRPALQQAA